MSEASAVTKVFYIFLIISFSSGFSLICFTDLRAAPVGKILQFKAKAYPHKWQLRTGLLVVLLLVVILAFFAVFKEKHRVNIVVAFLVLVLLVVEISLAGKRLAWRNEQTTVVNKQGDGNTMIQQYGVDPEVTKIMDYVQASYSCCGVTDYRDWASATWAALVIPATARPQESKKVHEDKIFGRQDILQFLSEVSKQKANAVPESCCKIPGPGCGDELDIRDPFENIFVQGCTQLLYFNKFSDHIHGGVGMAVLFLHWSAILGCILLACAVTCASGLTPIEALKGEEPEQKSEGSHKGSGTRGSGGKEGSGGKKGSGKNSKANDGTRKLSGDDLDFEEENKPPKGARNMLTDKSELETRQTENEVDDNADNGEV